MIINASGYLTLNGAGDDVVNASQVAKFVRYQNGIVTYELISNNIVVA
jgi:hypothetical protein